MSDTMEFKSLYKLLLLLCWSSLEFLTPLLLACFKSPENLIKSGYELYVGIGVNYIVYGYLVYYPKPLRSEMT